MTEEKPEKKPKNALKKLFTKVEPAPEPPPAPEASRRAPSTIKIVKFIHNVGPGVHSNVIAGDRWYIYDDASGLRIVDAVHHDDFYVPWHCVMWYKRA